MPAGQESIDDAQCMKPPVRGKYLVTEHAVELRRIIPAPLKVLVRVGLVRYWGVSTRHARIDRRAHSRCYGAFTSGHREVSHERASGERACGLQARIGLDAADWRSPEGSLISGQASSMSV